MADFGTVMNLLPAQADGLATLSAMGQTSLPFDPARLIILIAWVYLCMYCVQRVQLGALIPERHKTTASLVCLLTGPLLLLVLILIAAVQKSRRSPLGFLESLREQARGAMMSVHPDVAAYYRDEENSVLQLIDSSGRTLDEIYGHGEWRHEDAKVLDLTETVVADAIRQRASDILIDPRDESTYSVRLRIDGILRSVKELQTEPCRAIINSVKAVSGMDIAERRRPQDGAFLARRGDVTYSFRVASAGALNGEKLSIRILNKDAGTTTLRDLGAGRKQRTLVVKTMQKPSGMILVCGPTGSGKTTTMYAMLNTIDRYERNVITIEDPIEAILPETSQIEVNPRADITFAKTLRSVLRQDPDVICVGEIRDEETAEIALRGAQTGHLILATIHSDTGAAALIRLLDLGVSPLLISSGLNLIVTQRLLRCLCPRCKQPAELSDTQIAQFDQKRIDHSGMCEAGQCKDCHRTGYFGRTAIYDLLVVDEPMKAQIAQGQSFLARLKEEGTRKGRTNLRKEGLKRVMAGLTSLEELKRVVG